MIKRVKENNNIFVKQSGNSNNKEYICIYNIEKVIDFSKKSIMFVTSRGDQIKWDYNTVATKNKDLKYVLNLQS